MAAAQQARTVPAGTVLVVDETDYLYGGGTLRLRVDVPVELHPQMEWAQVSGMRVWESGREVDRLSVLVRVSAIVSQL